MKHLLLMRHAKAVPAGPAVDDRERPLAARGRRDAALIGTAIAEDGPPDIVVSSPSRRTIETMEDVIAALGKKPKQVIAEALYGGSVASYIDVIVETGAAHRRLLLIGHNPSVHQTALALVARPGKKLAVKFPTAALAVIAFDSDDWAEIGRQKGELLRFLRPKDLGAGDADD